MSMNLKTNPTKIQLQRIVQRADDNAARHMIWVGNDGEVHLDPLPENLTPIGYAEEHKSEMKFRFETFDQGNDYVGEKAAQDEGYVAMLFNQLTRSWASGDTGYIEY